MNKLQTFNFNDAQIRVIEIGGQPWFVLKDVCDVLGLRSPDVRKRLSDDVVTIHTVQDSLGRTNQASIINEDGLYDVILESRKPEARAFRKWVTSEVLPSIRQHGGYLTPAKIEEVLLNPDTIIDLAMRLKQANEEKAKLAAQIEADKPKVIFAEALETSGNSILIGELAKILKQNGVNIGQNRLFERLRQEGYLMKTKDERWNDPTQYSMELGLFEIKKRVINSPDGSVRTVKTTKVTPKGQIYFVNKFKARLEEDAG